MLFSRTISGNGNEPKWTTSPREYWSLTDGVCSCVITDFLCSMLIRQSAHSLRQWNRPVVKRVTTVSLVQGGHTHQWLY